MLSDIAHAMIAFGVIMAIVCHQMLSRYSWFWRYFGVVLWHEKNWHYEKHNKGPGNCDGLGVQWFHNGQWQAIPKDLRTNYPSLGNTRKCIGCVMGRVIVTDEPTRKGKIKP